MSLETILTIHKVLGFVSWRVTSKIIGIGSAQCSWDDVKTIKSGNIPALGSEISEKQSIVYTSACIEEDSWNDEDHVFGYKLYQWGVEKLFQNSDEVIIRELKFYIEDWVKLNINNNSQLSCTTFLSKYGSLAL